MEQDIIEYLKVISDTTRLRILNLLYYGDLCVCEIEYILKLNQSNTSRHLNNMSNFGVLQSFKVNKYTYYRVNQDMYETYPFIKEIINDYLSKSDIFINDILELKKYKKSGMNCDCLTKKSLQ